MSAWLIARLAESSTRVALSTLIGGVGAQLQTIGHVDWPSTAAAALIALSVAITPDKNQNPPPAGPSA
jgi:hypothetical protein